MSTPGETSDDRFLGGRITVRQFKRGHRTGIDGVLLQAAVPAKPGDQVFEAGIGAGVASLCLAARIEGVGITGAEIDPVLCDLARHNAGANALASRVSIIEADVTASAAMLADQGIGPDRFDHVLANPPFHDEANVRLPPDPGRARARAFPEGGLERWIDCLVRVLRPGGTLTLVHRPQALGQILSGLGGRCGAVAILPVQPAAEAPAHRVIIRAIKANRAPLTLLPALVLHKGDSGYLGEADAVLRDGAALAMTANGLTTRG